MVMTFHSVVCLTRELMFQQFRLCADNSYIQSRYSVILKQLDFYNSRIIFLILNYDSNRETMEIVTDLIFLASKITADGDCSHEIKRHQLLGRKAMTILDNILKSRDITLPTKAHIVRAMVFPVVMYGCESWTMKKLSAEEPILLNCGAGEDSWSPLDFRR